MVRSATTPADDQHFLGERESKGRGFCENEEGGGGGVFLIVCLVKHFTFLA